VETLSTDVISALVHVLIPDLLCVSSGSGVELISSLVVGGVELIVVGGVEIIVVGGVELISSLVVGGVELIVVGGVEIISDVVGGGGVTVRVSIYSLLARIRSVDV